MNAPHRTKPDNWPYKWPPPVPRDPEEPHYDDECFPADAETDTRE